MSFWGYGPKLKHVRDGMKLQSGKLNSKWWTERWLSALEFPEWTDRVYRGLTYARKGQVLNLKVNPGVATAMVQGTNSKPYSVSIKIKEFPGEAWEKVISVMSSRASYAAKLIIGEMPGDIEEVFLQAGVKLFPHRSKDLVTGCSCPDRSNPCKHVVAVYFVLADEFARDPFMIFQLRGRSGKEIMDELGRRRGLKSAWEPAGAEAKPEAEQEAGVETKPLSELVGNFWNTGREFDSFNVSIVPPRVEMALLKRLGPPAFCDRERQFWNLMKRIYRVVGEEARETALSERKEGKADSKNEKDL